MTFKQFLEECTMCGGNWTAMLITGIKKVAPEIYKEMPDRAFTCEEIIFIVNHLCYDRPHLRFHISLNGDIIEHTIIGTFVYRKATPKEKSMSAEEFNEFYNGKLTSN